MHPVRKLFHARPRLVIAMVGGALVTAFLPAEYRLMTRALIGWNAAVWSYLALVWLLMARADAAVVKKVAQREDENAEAILALACAAALVSLAAIVLELATSRNLTLESRLLHYTFTALTVLGSWFLVGTFFTLHYASMFYSGTAARSPLQFPEKETNPDYWDFLYFSFTIAVALQTSDVIILARTMRKAVLAQAVLSFLFNAAILGLSINIAAGLVGG
jgi:uncharacterized membrane protein